MPTYSVTGTVVGGVWLGDFEAASPEEAIEKAMLYSSIYPHPNLCYQCSGELDGDLEIDDDSLKAEEI